MRPNDVIKWAESRAEPEETDTTGNELEDLIMESRNIRGNVPVTQEMVLQIPTVKGCIGFISNMISMLPIKLYERTDGDVVEIQDDYRVRLLNHDTGDTLNPIQWKKAWIRDYFIGNGGFTYVSRSKIPGSYYFTDPPVYGDDFLGIHYVDESRISVNKNTDAIFKDFNVLVDGKIYYPWDFLIILRDTRDGCHNISITEENELLFRTAFQSMQFENDLVGKGGNKKGFVKAQKKLGNGAMTSLKEAFKKLYKNNSENVIVLNDGLDFKESSNTSVEMQLNENKETNAKEICKVFNCMPGVLDGSGNDKDFTDSFTMACLPVMKAMTTAFNNVMLIGAERQNRYFDFDTTELLKGSIKERYDAYKTALESGWLNIDDVRIKENEKPYGFPYINIGLDSVLYNPKTHEIYNPNANTMANMEDLKGGEISNESRNKE